MQKILTPAFANAKTAKNKDVLSFILHLAPAHLAGMTSVCPAASPGCMAACLNTAGRGQFTSIQNARINKTRWLFTERETFMAQLHKELVAAERKAAKLNLKCVVRLNGTSDLDWFDVIKQFPNIQFYDYTKRLDLLTKFRALDLTNYDLTFSRSEVNDRVAKRALELGFRVAVVFSSKVLPLTWLGVPVINGDNSDLRYLDPKGVVVGLFAKGKARKDITGFTVNIAETKVA